MCYITFVICSSEVTNSMSKESRNQVNLSDLFVQCFPKKLMCLLGYKIFRYSKNASIQLTCDEIVIARYDSWTYTIMLNHFRRSVSIEVCSLSQCAAFKNVIPSVRYDPVSFRYTRGCQSCRYTRRGRQVSTGRRKLCIPRESHSHRTNSPLSVSSLSVLHDNDPRADVKSRESSEEASS